jgi:steroid delta-isomerase-like uncharacterized protein
VKEFYNTGDMSALDRLYSQSYVHHQPTGTQQMGEFKEACQGLFANLSDLEVIIDDLTAEGDKVAKRWRAKFTHTGPYLGIPPTGNKGEVEGFSLYRVENGKLAECWEVLDSFGLMQALGAIPAPQAAKA